MGQLFIFVYLFAAPAVGICQDQHVAAIANPGNLQRLLQQAVQDAVWRPRHERVIGDPAPAGLRLQRLPHLRSFKLQLYTPLQS